MEFFKFKTTSTTQHEAELKSKPPLGERLRKIREEIVASGVSLLDWEGVEREKADRRGGYQEDAVCSERFSAHIKKNHPNHYHNLALDTESKNHAAIAVRKLANTNEHYFQPSRKEIELNHA